MKRLSPLMLAGTGSGVGKSLLAAGLCRIFQQDGYPVAPFKAQNMSLNSSVTPAGGEIGRAQMVQAQAARLTPHTDMNPILLKPTGESQSQIILNGTVHGQMSAREFFNGNRDFYFDQAVAAFRRLAEIHHPIVMEGAGSISELNLKSRDIVNLPMARAAGAAVYLVADIERGGIFGSVHGTIDLLSAQERDQIRGIIINKFRGDLSLFDEGREILQRITGKPVVGVIPHIDQLAIEDEDSLSLPDRSSTPRNDRRNVAVVRYPRISNFTDFDLIERNTTVHLFYTTDPDALQRADLILLPGSKNTIADLAFLIERGLDRAIHSAMERGAWIVGICGGYQMLGELINDPDKVESEVTQCKGLGLLPLTTTLSSPKITTATGFRLPGQQQLLDCYEIHMGKSQVTDSQPATNSDQHSANQSHSPVEPLFQMASGNYDGMRRGQVAGCYLHGAFDHPPVLDYLFNQLMGWNISIDSMDRNGRREASFDRLAATIRNHIDLDAIYRELGNA